ncbi:unnamed protein product, partial [Pylaiella littoralis]
LFISSEAGVQTMEDFKLRHAAGCDSSSSSEGEAKCGGPSDGGGGGSGSDSSDGEVEWWEGWPHDTRTSSTSSSSSSSSSSNGGSTSTNANRRSNSGRSSSKSKSAPRPTCEIIGKREDDDGRDLFAVHYDDDDREEFDAQELREGTELYRKRHGLLLKAINLAVHTLANGPVALNVSRPARRV